MQVITSSGPRNINVGDTIRIKKGFLPDYYDNKDLTVTRVETHNSVNYPFVLFYHEETYEDENGNQVTEVVQNEESAVSGDIIL